MNPVVLFLTLMAFSTAYPSFSIVPSYEFPSEHHYPVHQDALWDIPNLNQPSGFHHAGHYGPSNNPEVRTHVQHPKHGVSRTYFNRFDNDVGEKFNFNIGKGSYNIKTFPPEYQRQTYVAPDGQLYITTYEEEPKKQAPYGVPNVRPNANDLFTGNKANASSRPNTNFNRNIPRRTNKLGIPSAALASLAGGGLG